MIDSYVIMIKLITKDIKKEGYKKPYNVIYFIRFSKQDTLSEYWLISEEKGISDFYHFMLFEKKLKILIHNYILLYNKTMY